MRTINRSFALTPEELATAITGLNKALDKAKNEFEARIAGLQLDQPQRVAAYREFAARITEQFGSFADRLPMLAITANPNL